MLKIHAENKRERTDFLFPIIRCAKNLISVICCGGHVVSIVFFIIIIIKMSCIYAIRVSQHKTFVFVFLPVMRCGTIRCIIPFRFIISELRLKNPRPFCKAEIIVIALIITGIVV